MEERRLSGGFVGEGDAEGEDDEEEEMSAETE